MTTRTVYEGRFRLRATCARASVVVVASIGAVTLGACGDGGPSGPPGEPPVETVATVDVSPDAPTLVALGDTVELSATPRSAQGDTLTGETVTWASSDTIVAQVDSLGIVTAVANGTSTISATIDGVTGSAAVTVSQQGTSVRIAIMPPGAEAGVAFDIQPVVQVVDRSGHVVTNDDTTTITASIASGEGEIVGRESATVQAGVATFTDLGVRGVVGQRTLRFEAEGLSAAVSDAFTLMAGPPEFLRIRVEPGDAQAGSPLGTQPVIEIHDTNGNLAAGDDSTVVTVSIDSGGGSIISGEATTAQAGVATFTDLALGGDIGERTLRFEAEGLTAAVSDAFTLTAGPPESLRIRVEPAGAKAGAPLDTQPVVEIHGTNGNVAAGDDSTVVTVSIASGGGSIVSGKTATAQAGVATFADLAIDGDVGARTLRFEAEGLAATVSEPFTLTVGPAEALHIRVEPDGAKAGLPLDTQPVIEIRDADGNVTAGDDSTVVTVSIASGGGSIVSGETATAEAGVATFTDVTIDGDAGERTLRFKAEGLAAAVSEPFTLAAGPAQALHIRVEPGDAAAGSPLGTQPVIEIRDADGNVVADDDTTVVTASIASGGGSIVSGGRVAVQDGVATFADLAVGGGGGERTLRFRADGLGAAVSEAFALEAGPAASISLHDGDGQTALADTDLPVPLEVIVEDDFGNGVADVAVEWAVTAGTGTFQSNDGPTNDGGLTSSVYRLGRHPGVDTVEASAAGLDGSPVTFTATATPNGRISGTVTLTDEPVSAPVLAFGNRPPSAGARAAASRRMLAFGTGGTATASSPPAQPLRTASRPEFVPDELIVTFRSQPLGAPRIGARAYRAPATAAAVVTSMRRALGPHERAGAMTVVGVSPALLTARLRVDPRTIASVEQALRADPGIARVERNAIVYASARPVSANVRNVRSSRLGAAARSERFWRTSRESAVGRPAHRSRRASAADPVIPNDQHYVWQAWHYHMIDLPRAWDISTGSSAVIVALLDDGIRFDHPDIAPNLTTDGYDFVTERSIPLCNGGSTSGAGDGDDYDPDPTTPVKRPWNENDGCAGNTERNGGHGLHVAGIIGAASNNGSGSAGVSWNVSIRPIRVLDITGRGTHYDVAQGLLYAAGLPADDGAGGTVTAPSGAPIINMSLAGPDSSATLVEAVQAATDAGSLIIAAAGNAASSVRQYPAAFSQTVSVSAVQPDGSLASYSSFGPTIDIAAPGGEATSCDFGVWSTTWHFGRGEPVFACWVGTSMAAPHVTGVAALVLAVQPGLSNGALRARLLEYAVPGDPNQFGAGIVNARNSLTQSHAPARSLHVRLIDADNGATIATVRAANGSYEFTELDDGDYYVYAGEDEEGDGVIGVPVRRWGAAGGSAAPAGVTVDGAGNHPASFSIGIPLALDEPNPELGANVLPIGGYLMGELTTPGPGVHEFLVQVPTGGSYVFETSAVSGACGFALESNTGLELRSEASALIASNDDINAPAGNLCARIKETLQPGTYRLIVLGDAGRHAVSARMEP